jgi:hypothetical protein
MGQTTNALPPALPPGSRVLHVGPHKTGTAALQGAFHIGRAAALEHGVRYVGRTRQAIEAAHAVTSLPWQASGGRTPPRDAWLRLVDEVRRAREPRLLVSSESFANATAEQARRIADDLGPDRLHVVITLRPIARVLPSRWQQSVQDGITQDFEAWLRGVLSASQSEASGFWRGQRHDQLARRWAEVLGPERVTCLVADDADHRFVVDAFEALLGMPPDTLAIPGDWVNRSLTVPEVEAIRAFNLAFVGAGLGSALASPLHGRLIRSGVGAWMKARPPAEGEARLALPPWAADPVAGIATEIVGGLRSSGARLVGDVDGLLEVRTAPLAVHRPVPAAVALTMTDALLLATGRDPLIPRREVAMLASPAGRASPAAVLLGRAPEPPGLTPYTTRQLAGALAGRGWNAALSLRDAVLRSGERPAVMAAVATARRRWADLPSTEGVPAEEVAETALEILVATRFLDRDAGDAPGRLRNARRRRWVQPPDLAAVPAWVIMAAMARRRLRPGRRRAGPAPAARR